MGLARQAWMAFGCVVAATASVPAVADPDRDESGHGRYHHGHERRGDYKEEFWDGHCKVERKWDRKGGYKEERKCRGPGHYQQPAVVIRPGPAVVVYPPWMVAEPAGPVYRPGYEPAPARSGGVFRCNSQAVGNVLGGLLGGVLGNQIGGGSGRALATVGGAIAGVLIGGEIGRRMDARDQACIGQVLEYAPAGRRVAWTDPQNPGLQYAVLPGQVEARGNAHCRSYETEILADDQWRKTFNTACRRPDGIWIGADG